ncbi:hypothetical protein FRB93_004002 [Tulasnella sp. JGI-2019a]|nr:hypothetical protein FRB93_004002 [Tulasnella sp. JGI-2019a]
MDSLPPYNPSAEHDNTAGGLPSYDARGSSRIYTFSSTSGINDKLQTTYRIGTKHTPPLVLPSYLEAHLILLGAFHRLREGVRTQKGWVDVETPRLSPDELWAIFLERAVYRFEMWATKMMDALNTEEMDTGTAQADGRLDPDRVPPLDVILVWHTYMLNPLDYHEDCLRLHPGLLGIGSFPLLQLAVLIDSETLEPHPPTESQGAAWRSFTNESFDPPLTTTANETCALHCPNCYTRNTVNWLTPTGHGYGQRGFAVTCHQCEMPFGRETLGVGRFFADMGRCITDPGRHFLAKTLVDRATGMPSSDLAEKYTSILLNLKNNPRPQSVDELGRRHGWRVYSMEKIFRAGFMSRMDNPGLDTPRPVQIVLSAYRNVGPFSIDLASAVMRQMSFVDKMVSFGWTEQGRFEDDKDTLARCVSRYHAFLDLMVLTPGNFVVPTLDIDLAWHTHQLLRKSYWDLFNLMGTVPDHDDKVNETAIAEAYDLTAEAWKSKFGVPYSVCGCLPPSASKGVGGSNLFSFKGKAKASIEKPITNPRPDLISTLEMHADETHPSDHNAVAIINPPNPTQSSPQVRMEEQGAALAQARRSKMEKRAKEVGKLAEKGKADEWTELQSKRREASGNTHVHSFLCPVQFGAKDSFGKYGHGDCAVYSGRGLLSPLGAGDCVNGNGNTGMCGAVINQSRGGTQQAINTANIMTGTSTYMKDIGVANINSLQNGFMY